MNRSPAAVAAGLAIVALVLAGLWFLGREVVQLYGGLGAQFLALSLLVIAAAMIVASGLHRSGAGAERLYRAQSKFDVYNAYLQSVGNRTENIGGTIARSLALWASPRVIRAINARPADGCSDPEMRQWIDWLLREMRLDLKQSNLQLRLDRLIGYCLREQESDCLLK